MRITIREALKIGGLKECSLIAGEGGINNRIDLIDTMEVPNIDPWLKRNELLVTTGYSIQNDANALTQLIHALHSVGAAGLALKTRFLGEIPEKALAAANEFKLPIIRIPEEIPFVDITIPIMKTILDWQNSHLEFSEEIHNRFMELEVSGGGMDGIVQIVHRLLSMPVVITDEKLYILQSEGTAEDIKAIKMSLTTFNSKSSEKSMESFLISRPVCVKNVPRGYIFVLSEEAEPDEMKTIVLDHAATAVALEFTKLEVLNEHLRQMDSNLFLDIIMHNLKNETEAQYRAQHLKWPALPATLVVLDINNFESWAVERTEIEILNTKYRIEQMIQDEFPLCTVITKSDSFSCLIPASITNEMLFHRLLVLHEKIEKAPGMFFTAGISGTIEKYLELDEAYEDCRDAITISRFNENEQGTVCIENCRIEQALLHSEKNRYLRKYCDNTIGKLEEYDRKNRTELIHTLVELVRNMGVRTQTAEKLFLHRNTLLHRIRKIEEILECDLSRSEELLELAVALKAWKYFE